MRVAIRDIMLRPQEVTSFLPQVRQYSYPQLYPLTHAIRGCVTPYLLVPFVIINELSKVKIAKVMVCQYPI